MAEETQQIIAAEEVTSVFDLSRTPLTKRGVREAGERVAEAILESGEIDILDAFIRFRALRDMVDVAMSELMPCALDEVDYYGPSDRSHYGVAFDDREYTTYDYSDSPEWKALKEQEKALTARRKELEKAMRLALEKGAPLVNTTTGEQIDPARVKSWKRSLTLTFPAE